MPQFIVTLRENPHINDISMGTYTRDLKTLPKFFMKCNYLPLFEVKIPHMVGYRERIGRERLGAWRNTVLMERRGASHRFDGFCCCGNGKE